MKDFGYANVLSSQALIRDPRIPIPLPMNMVVPRNDPRFSGENILASNVIQAVATTPAPIVCQVRQRINNINASVGCDFAMTGLKIIRMIGNLSRNNPQPMTISFILFRLSVILAENNCGKNQPAAVITLINPIGINEGVNLLIKSGKIVDEEIKLLPIQKDAPSSKLTVKFHL